jgi:hypothetical protein
MRKLIWAFITSLVCFSVSAFGQAAAGSKVSIIPQKSGGYDTYYFYDVDEADAEVKAGPGQLYGWYLKNNSATETRTFRIYNDTTTNVTVGSTTPKLAFTLPPGAGANVFTETGIPFSVAITVACTTGSDPSNTGAPANYDCEFNLFYK